MNGEEFNLDDPVTSYVETWRRVVTEPRAFLEALPKDGGLSRPFAFAAISLFIGGIGIILTGGGLKGMVSLLIVGSVRLFVAAALVLLVARALFEGQGDYEATFRAIGYAFSPMVVFIGIPVVKFFAVLYAIGLTILAISSAQSFDTVRGALTLLAAGVASIVAIWALGLLQWALRMNPLLW